MVTSIKITSNYGLENELLLCYLVIIFLFWAFIYYILPKMSWDKDNIVRSISVLGLKGLSWVWFISIFYMFRAVLLISSSPTFLEDKLYLINLLFYLTIFITSIIGLLNFLKSSGKFTGFEEFFKNLIYEVRNKL